MVVTLIGYRGCGKSSVGPLLADLLGYEYVDSDVVIQQRAGSNIAEIFAAGGEPEFRRQESEVLKDLLSGSQLVIASGGGAILAEDNRKQMMAAGPVVWLCVSPEVLAKRISSDSVSDTQRPSLTGQSIEDEVAEVLDVRTPIYKGAATICVDAENGSPESIAQLTHNKIIETTEGGLK